MDGAGIRIPTLRYIGEIAIPKPPHGTSGQEITLTIVNIGRAVEVHISHRIDEELVGELLALLPHAEGNTRGQIATSAVAPHGDTACIDPQFPG